MFNEDILEHLLDIDSWLKELAVDTMLSVSAHFARCTCFNMINVFGSFYLFLRLNINQLERQSDLNLKKQQKVKFMKQNLQI